MEKEAHIIKHLERTLEEGGVPVVAAASSVVVSSVGSLTAYYILHTYFIPREPLFRASILVSSGGEGGE